MTKIITLILSLVTSLFVNSQVVYSLIAPFANPGWTSTSNIVGQPTRVLNYQPNLQYISSNDIPAGNQYVNGQTTSYTSPVINTTCLNSSTVTVNMIVGSDMENTFDWGYFQYSLNGGTTWINPVAASASVNNSGINMSAFPPLTNYVNTNSNRNGWTNSFGSNLTYTIPTSATSRFRFIFESDASVNSYTIGLTTYDRYFDLSQFVITCNVILPIELTSFKGYNDVENVLIWETASESNNDYFTLEQSIDGFNWSFVGEIEGSGTSQENHSYKFYDNNFRSMVNYYRLSQTDFDGTIKVHSTVAIDNTITNKVIVKTINMLGQEVDLSYTGLKIIIFSDGTSIKKIGN